MKLLSFLFVCWRIVCFLLLLFCFEGGFVSLHFFFLIFILRQRFVFGAKKNIYIYVCNIVINVMLAQEELQCVVSKESTTIPHLEGARRLQNIVQIEKLIGIQEGLKE